MLVNYTYSLLTFFCGVGLTERKDCCLIFRLFFGLTLVCLAIINYDYSGQARLLRWEPSHLPKLMKNVLEQRPLLVLGVQRCAPSRVAIG